MKCTYNINRFADFTFEDGQYNGKDGLFIYDYKNKCRSFTDRIKCIPKNHKEAEFIAVSVNLNWVDCEV